MEERRFHEEDFKEFLKDIISYNSLDNKEAGIAQLAVDKGYESLSEKQQFVLVKGLQDYIYDPCARCGLEIPWTEMSAAEHNGGVCGWCQQLGRDDD